MDRAVSEKGMTAAWRIIDTKGAFLIQCSVDVRPEMRLNNSYGDGCVAMDSNYDNLSVSELDGSRNVLRHKVVRFSLEGASSGHAEQILSLALDKVFRWCDESKKPFAMENLKLKHTSNRYGPKRKNYVTGRFAFAKITQLASSKALAALVSVTRWGAGIIKTQKNNRLTLRK